MRACVRAYTYVCVHTSVCVLLPVCVCAHVSVCISVRICVNAYLVRIRVRVSVHACASPWTHPYEDEDEHGDKVVGPGDRVLVGQAQQVHDGGAHAQDGLHLVPRGLVGVDGPDLSLCRGPGRLSQVHLGTKGRSVFAAVHQLYGFGYTRILNPPLQPSLSFLLPNRACDIQSECLANGLSSNILRSHVFVG